MKTLYWDFFGPNAEPMARHYLKHLDEFLVRNACIGCVTGSDALSPEHHAVYCKATDEFAAGIERTLKPKRVEPA